MDGVRQGIGLQPHDVRAFHHLDADPGAGLRPAGDRGRVLVDSMKQAVERHDVTAGVIG